MALGGGNFTVQNKVLPGTYINFTSKGKAGSALSERGTVVVPLAMNWGKENKVVKVTAEEFAKNSMRIFGYSNTAKELMPIRELFKNAKTVCIYRMADSAVKAEGTYAKAKFSGIRGNDIKIVIAANVDNAGAYDVITHVEGTVVDTQTVKTMAELKPNDFVEFKTDATLTADPGDALSGGTNGSEPTGASYTASLYILSFLF